MERYQFSVDQLSLMESMRIPFAVFQMIDGKVAALALSDGFCELFGYDHRAKAYHDMDFDMYRKVHPDDAARLAGMAARFVKEDDTLDVIYRGRPKGSAEYHIIHAFGRHVTAETGARLGYLWYADEGPYTEETGEDRTGLNQSLRNALHEESMLKASRYDALTGLPRMNWFFDLATAGKDMICREGGNAVMLYMNLNGMKFFNHTHSFAEGDELLKAFAALLARTFGSDNCCRVGADHFAAFTREEGLEDVLRRFLRECREINGGKSLTVKVGVYSTRMGDVHVSTACDRAKMACDTLKGGYESEYSYYNQKLSDKALNRGYIVENIDRAIREGWIQVYYQPIVRAVNGRVCDEEALARWIDPVKGVLSPAEFIPYLEDAGLIYKLDLCVLDQVLNKIKRQEEASLQIVSQSINLSRSDFEVCDIVEELRRRVDAAGVSRDKITVEITESMIGSDFEFMKAQVERLQSLGFPVWMDDFGSGYSSLDVLQSIKFNLLKFDMSFMQKLDEGDSGKIILTELMKMASALGVDTVCEGVETEAQVRFLREIGCSKLQGYYFCRPIPYEKILERYHNGTAIGFENEKESEYYEAIGRVNLYDMAVIANEEENVFQNFFNTLPMGIVEMKGAEACFVRTNQSYRDFIRRFFGMELTDQAEDYAAPDAAGSSFIRLAQQCCDRGGRAFFDDQMPDGSIVHFFLRRIAMNPVTGSTAVAAAVLSITQPDEGATYASIARALAADYYNIYYVDLETDKFIEYSSSVGGDELAMERHGEHFFEASIRESYNRIYEEDRPAFMASFTKENIIRELDQQGVFTITYRLIDSGKPMYVNMKITRMQPGGKRIIIGISIIDSQMKQKEEMERIQRERDTLARVMALSEDYLTLYMVNPETDRYVEYNATDEYKTLGLAVEGEDFFRQCIINAETVICPEDRERFKEQFTKENILKGIREAGIFKMNYKLMIQGEERPVTLKIAPFKEAGEERLVMGVRAWRIRQ